MRGDRAKQSVLKNWPGAVSAWLNVVASSAWKATRRGSGGLGLEAVGFRAKRFGV